MVKYEGEPSMGLGVADELSTRDISFGLCRAQQRVQLNDGKTFFIIGLIVDHP